MTATRGHSALRYDRLAQEAGGLGDSHRWLLDRVPAESRVLDCGCAGGFLAEHLRKRGCVIDGIEFDSAAADRARDSCDRVFVGSLEDPDFMRGVSDKYDRIIFGDVLEHLVAPADVLRRVRHLLSNTGRILVSLPNVAHWSIRVHLLRGRFEYTDWGLLDRTHLRFYTHRTARELVEGAGFQVTQHEYTIRLRVAPFTARLIRPLAHLRPNLFAYQTLLEARSWPT